MKITLESLESVFPFVSQLQPQVKKELLSVAQLVSLPANSMICAQSDQCGALSLLSSGRVRVYKISESGREISLYRIHPGESCVLTASCILSDVPFPAFAQTEVPSQAVSIPVLWVKKWMQDPVWQSFIFSLVSHRLANVIELVEEVAFKHMDERIAHLLLQRLNTSESMIHITHQKIADELGSSREVISRILKDMEQRHILSMQRGKIIVQDEEKLQQISKNI